MKIPIFLVLFVIFLYLLNHKMNKVSKQHNERRSQFYKREHLSLLTRRKPLDNLEYLHMDKDNLPNVQEINLNDLDEEDKNNLEQDLNTLETCINKPMVNFKGKTNTDLKLEYGVANLETLISYETTYNDVIIALANIGSIFYKYGNYDIATKFFEEGVRLETDISRNYILLYNIYKDNNEQLKLNVLKDMVSVRDLPLKDQIMSQMV